MDKKMPNVSIITTNWNRCQYIERVWRSIESQTHRNIEWIVCDDGSSDGSVNVIEKIILQATIPVVFIKSSVRVGKAVLDNAAIKIARSSMILWNDSDDFLLPDAIKEVFSAWESRPKVHSENYIGVIAFATVGKKIITTSSDISSEIHDTWDNIRNIRNINGDGILLLRRDKLLKNLFPEVDFVIPESVVWCHFSTMISIVVPKPLQVREYNSTENSISYSGKMQYNRGNAHALCITESELILRKRTHIKHLGRRLKAYVNFIRYSIHGEINLIDIYKMTVLMKFNIFYVILIPVSILLSIKDILQKKVLYTHREFEHSKYKSEIKISRNFSISNQNSS